MTVVETFLGLIVVLGVLALLAPRIRVPLSVILVAAGAIIALVPGLPTIILDPEIVFLMFVPPIIYYAAFFSPWRDLRENLRPITLLASALVLTTMVCVAFVAHHLMPGFSWPLAFVPGAIVSPSDAVAVVDILKDLRLPRRLLGILKGESLLNDPTAFISYRMAVAAVVAGTFSLWQAGVAFLYVAVGGILVGLLLGRALVWLRTRLNNPAIETTTSMLTPYAAFLAAEKLGVSGVLCVLIVGLYLGLQPRLASSVARLQLTAAWGTLLFILNGLVFLLMGMQIPPVMRRLGDHSFVNLAWEAAVICLTVIGVRFVWVFANICYSCAMARRRDFPWGELVVTAWTGMRGLDSLVTALALPLVVASGEPFPQRDRILFVTACVIVATLLLQGLTMPALVRRLGVSDVGQEDREEAEGRYLAAQAALMRIQEEMDHDPSLAEVGAVEQLRSRYEARLPRYAAKMRGGRDERSETQVDAYHRLLNAAIDAERQTILMLRDQGRISNDVMHRIERDLDLEEARHTGEAP
ncbi:Sodium, potassium, lithium and rubidium/H(+) antiporter [compost metagenome]